jgi:protein required for attachment to host cells
MKIPSNTLVLVADGRKAMILRNAGDEKFPNLKIEWAVMDQNPTTAEQGSDRPGRVNFRSRRSSVEQTDWHAQEEAAFTRRTAAAFDDLVRDLKTADVVIVAPPKTLSILRQSLDHATSSKVIAELPHDLVYRPIGDIEAHLGRATNSP